MREERKRRSETFSKPNRKISCTGTQFCLWLPVQKFHEMSRTASEYPFSFASSPPQVSKGPSESQYECACMFRSSWARSRYWLTAVVQAFEWRPQQRHQLSADFHQIQEFLAVGHESLELLRTREQLTQRHLLVEFRLGYSHYFDVRERGTERSGRHLQALENIWEQQPVSRSEKKNEINRLLCWKREPGFSASLSHCTVKNLVILGLILFAAKYK